MEDFKAWKQAHDELLNSVAGFWNCVQHILCADAPEGLIPDEMEEEASLDTKEILSYSWRGVKEARYVYGAYCRNLLIVQVFCFAL
jgi:hypothetical protein